MPQRVNKIMLLGLVVALILSLGLLAGAQSGGGAVGTALGQVGKPYAFGTDGPGTFSCTGLVRFALRSIGIMDAPWDHHAYLSQYPTVASPEPGDVVVYPDGAAMYIGNGQIVMANHADGAVGTYDMNAVGTPIGFARPTGGPADPVAANPAVPAAPPAGDPALADPALTDPALTDPALTDPALTDPAFVDQAALNPALTDPAFVDPAIPVEPMAGDPMPPVEQAPVDPMLPVEQAPVDPMLPV